MSSVLGIFKRYSATFRSARDGRFLLKPFLAQICIPIVVGALSAVFGPVINNAGNAVTGISVVAALLCAAATMLFQIRIELEERMSKGSQVFLVSGDLDLVDELFSQVIWAILIGFCLVLLMLGYDWFNLSDSIDFAIAAKVVSGVIVSGVLHFVMVIAMVLKRFTRIYELVAEHKR